MENEVLKMKREIYVVRTSKNNLSQKNETGENLKMPSDEFAFWERRIQPMEWHLKEELVSPNGFDMLCEKTTKTIFNIVDEAKNESMKRTVQQVISKLSPNQRNILHLIFWEGLSEQEIADNIKVPRKTISNRKFAAFREIEKKCGQLFLSYEGTSFETSNLKPESRPQNGCLTEHKITGVKNEL